MISSCLLLITCMLSGCFSDDSNEDIIPVNDFEISGVESHYTATSYVGEVLTINPVVETGYPEADVEYQWLLLDENTGTVTEAGDTIQPVVIGNEKNLNYEVNLAPSTYMLRFIARCKSNNYAVHTFTRLTTVTEFSSGFYIMKETADGMTDLDLFATSGVLAEDLLAKTKGAALSGKPYSMWVNYGQYYINPDNDAIEAQNSVTVITDNKQFVTLRTTDLGTMFDRSNLQFEEMDASEQPYAFLLHAMYGMMYFSSNGLSTANHQYSWSASGKSAGKFGMPDAVYGSKYLTLSIPTYSSGTIWDEQSHSLLTVNYNMMASPATYMDFTGEELTQNLMGYECLSAGISRVSSSEVDNFVLEDTSTGTRYVYLLSNTMSGQYLTNRITVPASSHMAKATAFATCALTGRYIYCVDNNKVYGYNYSNDDFAEAELSTPGIGAGETITYICNPFISGSGSDVNFNYLLVATQSGNAYKIYMYDTVGGAPVGDPIYVTQGTGKVKCVRNISPRASVSTMATFGNFVYPIND